MEGVKILNHAIRVAIGASVLVGTNLSLVGVSEGARLSTDLQSYSEVSDVPQSGGKWDVVNNTNDALYGEWRISGAPWLGHEVARFAKEEPLHSGSKSNSLPQPSIGPLSLWAYICYKKEWRSIRNMPLRGSGLLEFILTSDAKDRLSVSFINLDEDAVVSFMDTGESC